MEEKRYEALRTIYERLKDTDVTWGVSGSTGLALRGVDVEPKDIDIIVDGEDAYTVEEELKEYIVKEVEYSESDVFRSYFGKLEIEGIEVEVMGDLEKKVGGKWEGPTDVKKVSDTMKVKDMKLPIFKLGEELESYRKLGRSRKAEKIKEALDEKEGEC